MYHSSGNYEAFADARKPAGADKKSAYIVGGGLAGLAAAVFMIRDAKMSGKKIQIFEDYMIVSNIHDLRRIVDSYYMKLGSTTKQPT